MNLINELPVRKLIIERLSNTSISSYTISQIPSLVDRAVNDPELLLVVAKIQFSNQDQRWIISLLNYLNKKAKYLSSINKLNDSVDYFKDSLGVSVFILETSYMEKKNTLKPEKLMEYIERDIFSITTLLFQNTSQDGCDAPSSGALSLVGRSLGNKLFKKIADHLKKRLPILVAAGYLNGESRNRVYNQTVLKDFINSIAELKSIPILKELGFELGQEKKRLRKEIFSNMLDLGSRHDEINLAQSIHLALSKIHDTLGDIHEGEVEMSQYYQYIAYNSQDVDKVSASFTAALDSLTNSRLNKIEREYVIARKHFYLSVLQKDDMKILAELVEAEKHFSYCSSYKALSILPLISFYKVRVAVSEDVDAGVSLAKKSIKELVDKEISKDSGYVREVNLLKVLASYGENDQIVYASSDSTDDTKLINIVHSWNCLQIVIGENEKVKKFYDQLLQKCFLGVSFDRYVSSLFFVEGGTDISEEKVKDIFKDFREKKNLEFKASIRKDVGKFLKIGGNLDDNPDIEKEFLKTIVGFLNSKGGAVVTGVIEKSSFPILPAEVKKTDLGDVWGIGISYDSNNFDKLQLLMKPLIDQRIGQNVWGLLDPQPLILENGLTICYLEIPEGNRWYYLDNKEFYVREHNSTQLKWGSEVDDYKISNPR